jgi:pimeloyl-ACP methyl ester carboxylesterase
VLLSSHCNLLKPCFGSSIFLTLVVADEGTVPVKLLLQLATVFQPGGLRDRSGTVIYKDGLKSCKVPVLAIAGDLDLICPPPAVLDTIKAFPGATVTYKLFGGKHERHYGHYDLLCARTVSSFSKLPNVFCTLQFPYITVTKNNAIRSPLITPYLLV